MSLNDILNPGGLLQQIMEYIDINSPVSIPIFNLAAATTFLGAVAGQKFQTETGLRTNLYSIALGFSGSGKNSPFATIPSLVLQTKAQAILGPTELTSAAAIIKWLSLDNQRVTLLMLDEIGLLLKGINYPNSYASEIPRILIKLFSATDRSERKAYANKDSIFLPWHHLSFYGASTPDRFWESITPGEIADGFLARILVWENLDDAPFPKNIINQCKNKDIQNEINYIFSTKISHDMYLGNLAPVPIPNKIYMNKEAKKIILNFSLKYHNLKNEYKNDSFGKSSIYGRCAEHAYKLSLIHWLSIGDKTSKITEKSTEWASSTIDYLTKNLIKQIDSNIASNENERIKNKILKWIQSKEGPVSLRDIHRGPGRSLSSADLKKIMESLIVAEFVSVKRSMKKIEYEIIKEDNI